MKIERIKIRQFKNLEQKDFVFSSNINFLVGKNGVGKTTVLDAVHYICNCRSYFSRQETYNVQFEKDFFSLDALLVKEEIEEHIFCLYKQGEKKQFKRNEKQYKRLSDHIGLFPAVMISPYDRDLIMETSEVRRRFMDGVVGVTSKDYLDNLVEYSKCLQQRNSLLKSFFESGSFDDTLLSFYSDKLVETGTKIHGYRKKFVSDFNQIFEKYYKLLSGNPEMENVAIVYQSVLNEADFKEVLTLNLSKDRKACLTTSGIHKDDLVFSLNAHPIKKIGSQGQQKTFQIALKLAKLEMIKNSKNMSPILLLDDIFDKLDETRVFKLVELVNNSFFGQIFVSDTDLERVQKIASSLDSNAQIIHL